MDNVDLNNISVSRPIKVKAFDECEQTDDKTYRLVGNVSRTEALVLEKVLKLHRREAGTLSQHELSLVASLLTLKGQ